MPVPEKERRRLWSRCAVGKITLHLPRPGSGDRWTQRSSRRRTGAARDLRLFCHLTLQITRSEAREMFPLSWATLLTSFAEASLIRVSPTPSAIWRVFCFVPRNKGRWKNDWLIWRPSWVEAARVLSCLLSDLRRNDQAFGWGFRQWGLFDDDAITARSVGKSHTHPQTFITAKNKRPRAIPQAREFLSKIPISFSGSITCSRDAPLPTPLKVNRGGRGVKLRFYRPAKDGRVFSRKALVPLRKSSEEATKPK